MNIRERLENLRKARTWKWGELSAALGIKSTMLHYVRTGDRHLGPEHLRRLEELEIEAKIRVPRKDVMVVREDSGEYVAGPRPGQAEDEKHLRALERTIESAQEQIKKLRERMKGR